MRFAMTMADKTDPSDDAHDDGRGQGRNATAIDKRVGMRVRLRRKQLGMSAEDLGQKLGIAQQQVQKYETGLNRISAARLFELASILDVPLAWFYATAGEALDEDGGPRANLASTTDMARAEADEVAEVVRLFMGLSDPQLRNNILTTLRLMHKARRTQDEDGARRTA
jgi:transcriptional regulator with XRE-family HTH domain